MRGDQKNGLPRRGAGPERNPEPDLGGSDGDHGSQTSAPLHEMSESLTPGMADSRLVLLRKEGRLMTSSSTYRPICLLDEVGKLRERVVAAFLERHMAERVQGWHKSQYGFRKGRSTIDVVRRVRVLMEDMV